MYASITTAAASRINIQTAKTSVASPIHRTSQHHSEQQKADTKSCNQKYIVLIYRQISLGQELNFRDMSAICTIIGMERKSKPRGYSLIRAIYRYVRPQKVQFSSRFGHKHRISTLAILVSNRVCFFHSTMQSSIWYIFKHRSELEN